MATKKSSVKKPAAKKPAAKKAVAKKPTAKKVTTKKATAKKAIAKPVKINAGLVDLLSKIQIQLEDGKKQKLSKTDIVKAQECLNKNGKILLSFKKVIIGDGGTGTVPDGGTGTRLID